jgi:alkylation response protein AidB-like acyl-CoA dehydrogenase
MLDWSEDSQAIIEAVRRFVDEEIRPQLDAIEHEGEPPYEILRSLYRTFGIDQLEAESFERAIARKERGEGPPTGSRRALSSVEMGIIPTIELSRVSPGLVTSLGVSTSLAGGTIMKQGTLEQMRRWGKDLLTLDKIGAWAITEPDSGSDALGGMRTTAVRDGDEYVLNGQKTWITNGPYADTIVLYAKLDDGSGTDLRSRPVLTFILDKGMEGLTQAAAMRKMGQRSSPTGEVFLADVRCGVDRLLGGTEGRTKEGSSEGRSSAKSNFTTERAGVAAMALGIVEECLRVSIDYAKHRELWGKPIADFQLIQLKLATMEVARINLRNLIFRYLEATAEGYPASLAEASAMKLYSAKAAVEVANEAIQLFGGNGYISEYRVEQLARDARVLQIYAGTDEMQVVAIAKDLLRREQ